MKLTRISDKQIGSLFYMKKSEYPAGLWLQFFTMLEAVAQAQLEAAEKEADKKVQEMFDKIQELFFTFDGDGELILRSEMNGNRKVDEWQALKEGVK